MNRTRLEPLRAAASLVGASTLCLAGLGAAAWAADAFAPAGAKASLSVDYVYESTGQKRSEGLYDPYNWRVKRSVTMAADLAAQAPTAMPTLQALDAAQTAQLKSQQGKSQAVATKMAPMMADVEKMMAKCGEDEACLTREAQKMGAALQGTPQMAAAMSARKDAQELTPGSPRYQSWRATAQKGSYRIDESVHISVPDPICVNRPRQRCTRDEVRTGAGEIPLPPEARKDPRAAAGLAAVEVDTGKSTLTLALPVPLFALPYTETITSDEPAGTHDTPTPKGPRQKLLHFRVNAGGVTHDKPITVALKGGWRSQSGEQAMNLNGEFGDAGKLTVRWRFSVQ